MGMLKPLFFSSFCGWTPKGISCYNSCRTLFLTEVSADLLREPGRAAAEDCEKLKKEGGLMNIALASDHAGFQLKQGVLSYLEEAEIPHKDFGCFSEDRVDYVDFAAEAVQAVVEGRFDRCILVCGAGLGMAIVANKFKGIRATPCYDEYMTEMSRKHNDSNCLTLGGRILPLDEALRIVQIWLETSFEKGRHEKRIQKIALLEEKHFIARR
jgi:ribose 5-phosphate isomerase B